MDLTQKHCEFCDKPSQPFEYRMDVICLYCSVEMNDALILNCTDIKGNVKNKRLLKRRYRLRELLNQTKVEHLPTEERENIICRGCSKHFVALKANKLLYCGDCTKFKKQMEDIRLRHELVRLP